MNSELHGDLVQAPAHGVVRVLRLARAQLSKGWAEPLPTVATTDVLTALELGGTVDERMVAEDLLWRLASPEISQTFSGWLCEPTRQQRDVLALFDRGILRATMIARSEPNAERGTP